MIFKNKTIEKEKAVYELYFRADLFHPFKECDPNVISPTFIFFPQIGVNSRRSKKHGFESVRVIFGWLNAYAEFSVSIYKKITMSLEDMSREVNKIVERFGI